MTISTVSLTDTFLVWMTRTNSIISVGNDLTDGNTTALGTLTITNPNKFQSNVSLNVHNGVIRGDGGLLWNINPANTSIVGKITNAQLANSTANLISNSASLRISGGNVALGGFAFASLIVTNALNDQNTTNMISAGAVNSLSNIVTAAYAQANTANTQAFAVSIGPPYDQANAANVLARAGNITANAAFDKANAANITADTVKFVANLAYDKANAGNSIAQAGMIAGNLAFDKANTANRTADAAFARGNTEMISLIVGGNLDAVNNINVIPYCAFTFDIAYAYARIDAGSTIRVQVRNGNSNVTNLEALTVGQTAIRNVATAGFSFAVGDRLQVTLSNKTSSEKNLEMMFAITKTGP